MAERTVRTRWDGGMRAVTQAGNFEVVVDEPEWPASGASICWVLT